jgi:hypothetical protein
VFRSPGMSDKQYKDDIKLVLTDLLDLSQKWNLKICNYFKKYDLKVV